MSTKQLIFFDPTFTDESLQYQVKKLVEGTDFIPTGYLERGTTQHFVEALSNAYEAGVKNVAVVLPEQEYWKQCENTELLALTDRLFESFELFKSQGHLSRLREALSADTAEDLAKASTIFISPKEYLKFLVVSVMFNLAAFELAEKAKGLGDPFPVKTKEEAIKILTKLRSLNNFQTILKEDSQLAKLFDKNTERTVKDYGLKFYANGAKLLKPEHLKEGSAWLQTVAQRLQVGNFIDTFRKEILENPDIQKYLEWKPGNGNSEFKEIDKSKLAIHKDGCFHVYIVSLNLPTIGAVAGFKQMLELRKNSVIMLAGPRSTDWGTLISQYGTLMNPNIQFGVLKKMTGLNSLDLTNMLAIRIYDKAKFYEDITEMMSKAFSDPNDKVNIYIAPGVLSLLGENEKAVEQQIRNDLVQKQQGTFGGQIKAFISKDSSFNSLMNFPNKGVSVQAAKIIDQIIKEVVEEKDEKKVAEKSAYAWLVKYSKEFIEAAKEKQDKDWNWDEKDTNTLDKQKKTQKNAKNKDDSKAEVEEDSTNKSKAKGNKEEVEKKKQLMVKRLEAFSASKYKWVAFMIASIQLQKEQGLLEKDKDKKNIDLSLLSALVREADKKMASEYIVQLGGEIFLEMGKHLKKFYDKMKQQLKDAQKVFEEDKKKSNEEKILLRIGTHEAFFSGGDNPKFLMDQMFEKGAY